jgi:type IV pilus assembly protein PilY1
VIEIDTGVGSAGDPNGLSTPRLADLDGDGTVDRVYAGDVHGNMWAFDMSSGSTPSIVGNAPIFTTIGNEPITTPPVLAKHPTISNDGTNYPNVMVYFGSGQYLTNTDKTDDTTLNRFYGIWDNAAQNISVLHQQTFLNGYTDTFGNPVRVLTNTPVNYAGGESGWYFELDGAGDSGEKLIFEPSLRGGIVFFNTFVPDSDPCGEGGDSWAMFVDMVNGGSADDPQSDTNNDGIIDDKDRVSDSSGNASLMTSAGSKGEGELYPNNNFLGDLVYRGDDPDEVKELRDIPTGRFSWQELIQ